MYIGCRLSRQSYPGVIHYSLLLMLFGAAAFKAVHTPLLTTMLMSELASMLCLAGKWQAGNPVLSQFSVSRFPWHQQSRKAAVQFETFIVDVREQTLYS